MAGICDCRLDWSGIVGAGLDMFRWLGFIGQRLDLAGCQTRMAMSQYLNGSFAMFDRLAASEL